MKDLLLLEDAEEIDQLLAKKNLIEIEDVDFNKMMKILKNSSNKSPNSLKEALNSLAFNVMLKLITTTNKHKKIINTMVYNVISVVSLTFKE